MDLELHDKIIIVTGGAKGIGEAITRMLAAEGAIPVILGRNEFDNMQVVENLKDQRCRADQIVAELSDPNECRKQLHCCCKNMTGLMVW
jgi:L-fucose dehydrogenase